MTCRTNKELHMVSITFLVEGDFEMAISAANDVAEYIVEVAELTRFGCLADTEPMTVEQAVAQFEYEDDDDEEEGNPDQPADRVKTGGGETDFS